MKNYLPRAVLLSILVFGAGSSQAAPGEKYPQTRARVLSAAEVAQLSAAQRRYAINEIYARHGLLFGDMTIRKQFLHLPWYKPQPGRTMAQIKSDFSRVERQNVERLGLAREVSKASQNESVPHDSDDFYISPYADSSRALKGERFPETRLGKISSVDIGMMNTEQCRYATNEIYARHGYLFRDMTLRKQFLGLGWYKPKPGRTMDQIRATMTSIERNNLDALSAANQ